MKVFEFDQNQISTGYYDPAKDEYTKRHLDDTRKPELSLMILNRLKRMRALRKLEALKRQDLLGVMYNPVEPPGGMMGGPGGF